MLREVLDAFAVKHYELSEYEADDIIGTLAKRAEKENWDVNVISGDKDLLQLVSDKVKVNLTRKGLSEVDTYTPAFLEEKLEIKPEQVIHMKALMGDNSDNIPGVPGVGQKTAIKLLSQFETLENLYDNIDEVSGKKLKEKLDTHKDDAFMSKELATIQCDSPIEIGMDDITYTGYDARKVSNIFKELSFQSLLNRISGELSGGAGERQELSEIEVEEVKTITENMLSDEAALELEMLEDNYHTETIIGIGLVTENKKYYIPTELAIESDSFKKWAEDNSKKKFVFDAKKVRVALLKHGIKIAGIQFDLLLASYLINPSENHHDIPAISHRMGHNEVLFDEEVYGKGAKKKLPEHNQLMEHIARKTNMVFALRGQMEQELKQNSQYELLKDLELPLALILGDMESIGVQVDRDRLIAMGSELQERLKTIESEVYELAGEEFNLNSPKQLGPILFEKLGLPVIKKTKTGYSTSADILEQLEDKHEIIPKLLLYRQLGKLQSTYIEGLLKVIHPETNKIHTRYNQALTQTGRLSSTEPNLQNIPIRLEEGKKIRQAFVSSQDDWLIFAADYSQIELRVLAHIANDDKLIQAFKDDMDIHTRTAMEVFHVSEDEVTSNMRRHAKAVNFGIVYGISDYGLSQSLSITRKEAQKFIDRYLDSYPGVKAYMDEIVQDAKQKGYVTTLMNRRRYLPDITSRNFNRRSFAERTAMNTPIQGSAADIIKMAMINLYHQLQEENLKARMLMQVHDELILEAPSEEVEKLKQLVPSVMENAIELAVPLKVDYAYGKTWYDAK